MRTREFKDTELGPIPKDWEVKRLGDQAEVFCDGDWIEAKDQSSTGFRLIQTGNVGEGIYKDKPKNKRYVSEKTFNSLRCTEIFGGDVLVSRLPDPIGRACIVPNTAERKITAVDCTIIRFAEYDPVFFVAFSQTKCYRQMVDSNMAGSTRMRISRNALGKILVPYPPLPEQRRIAAALGDVDKLIENLKKRVEKKKNLKRGAMQELLTGRRRLKGFTGAWVEKRLGDLLDYEQPQRYIVKSSDYCDSGIPVLTPGKSFILGYTTEMDGVCENLPVILFDDFLTISRYITFPFKVKSSAVKMLRLRNANDSMYFIQAAMESLGYVPGDHQRHWIGIFSKLTILMPECVEQRAIAAVLSDMDAEIANLEAKLKKMTLLKQGIMQDLLTGKVRLV